MTSHIDDILEGLAVNRIELISAHTVLASMLYLKDKRSVSRIIHSAVSALMKDFVHHHLGFHHIDRRTVLPEHQTAIATQLMAERDDQVIIVMDGTYLFVQKSSDNCHGIDTMKGNIQHGYSSMTFSHSFSSLGHSYSE